jgi:hypothetical protein
MYQGLKRIDQLLLLPQAACNPTHKRTLAAGAAFISHAARSRPRAPAAQFIGLLAAHTSAGYSRPTMVMKIPKPLALLLEEGLIDEVIGRSMSGKEATVHVVRRGGSTRCANVHKDVKQRSHLMPVPMSRASLSDDPVIHLRGIGQRDRFSMCLPSFVSGLPGSSSIR